MKILTIQQLIMNKLIFIGLLLIVNNLFSQDLKTTEIEVVEGLDVSIPEANKLNVKASFQDTTEVDKTQEYSFVDKYLFSSFDLRPLSAAKIKRKIDQKVNYANFNFALGNRKYKFGNINYSGKLKDKLIYSLGFKIDLYDYTTKNDINVKKESREYYLYTKSILKKGVLNSRLSVLDLSEFHQHSKEETPDRTYSEVLISYNSSDNKKLQHSSQLLLKDFNNQIENQIGLYTDILYSINNLPLELSLEYNNYINYINRDPSFEVDKLDVKILDVTPNLSIEKYGFGIDLGFNLGIGIAPEKSFDIFPIIEFNKELVDNIINLSFGIDRDDYRNTLSSLTLENPYIHTPGISTNVEDSVGYFHELETTDIYECYINLDNKLSKNQILSLNLGYGKLLNLHYFDYDETLNLNRFDVNYIDTWRLRAKANYQRKFNNVLSLNLDAQYNWYNEEIPHKTNLEANLSLPVKFREKLKFIPSVKYIGERKYSLPSTTLIFPPEREMYSLEDQYLANLKIYYSYTEKLDFSIEINNILDVQKPYWYGYDQIGLNFNFSVNYIL